MKLFRLVRSGVLQVSSSTHLLFCTTGILLRRLEEDPDLEGVTHVFVDEVHERSIESDFLLMVLRDMLRRNKKLRLCLMSATLDVDLFGNYFDKAPFVSIPGAEGCSIERFQLGTETFRFALCLPVVTHSCRRDSSRVVTINLELHTLKSKIEV